MRCRASRRASHDYEMRHALCCARNKHAHRTRHALCCARARPDRAHYYSLVPDPSSSSFVLLNSITLSAGSLGPTNSNKRGNEFSQGDAQQRLEVDFAATLSQFRELAAKTLGCAGQPSARSLGVLIVVARSPTQAAINKAVQLARTPIKTAPQRGEFARRPLFQRRQTIGFSAERGLARDVLSGRRLGHAGTFRQLQKTAQLCQIKSGQARCHARRIATLRVGLPHKVIPQDSWQPITAVTPDQ